MTTKRSRHARVDDQGRAYAGSQLHLQVYVNRWADMLNDAVAAALRLEGQPHLAIRWVSPLEARGFREYRDAAFLEQVGLESAARRLKAFWPVGGPRWDGLALVERQGGRTAVVLVEAKSYPGEVLGRGCLATPGSVARRQIEVALDATAAWLGAQRSPEWTGALYQHANRLAHLYFLRELVGADAYLANVQFEGDSRRPTSAEAWRAASAATYGRLGLAAALVPWCADVLLPATQRSELTAER